MTSGGAEQVRQGGEGQSYQQPASHHVPVLEVSFTEVHLRMAFLHIFCLSTLVMKKFFLTPKTAMPCLNAFARQLIQQSTWQTIFRSWNTFDWASLAKHPESSKASLFFSLICPPIVLHVLSSLMVLRVTFWNLLFCNVKAGNTRNTNQWLFFLFQGTTRSEPISQLIAGQHHFKGFCDSWLYPE